MTGRGLLLAAGLAFAGGCTTTTSNPAPPGDGPDGGALQKLYQLPYEAGTRRTCVQPGPGLFSHHGSQRYAVDFAMPVGTKVLAARAGTVVETRSDSDVGGPSQEYADKANLVRIRHDDGTRASYLHFMKDGVAVAVGARVAPGDVIGYAGSTGMSAMPHVHLQVDHADRQAGRWMSIPIAFADIASDGVPRFLAGYTAGGGAE